VFRSGNKGQAVVSSDQDASVFSQEVHVNDPNGSGVECGGL
jgi:hypothetical protein